MKKIIIIALMFLGALQVQGQTVKTGAGIPVSVTYAGNTGDATFNPNGALVYEVTDASPDIMTVDFGGYDMAPTDDDPADGAEGQLNAGKYLLQVNSTATTQKTVIVKGSFSSLNGNVALFLSGIVGYANSGTGLLRISVENLSMPDMVGGNPLLLIMAKTGGSGPTEQSAMNLKGFQYPGGMTYGPIDDQLTMGDPGADENSNQSTNFLSGSLPISWTRIWTEGLQVRATGVLTGQDVTHVTCEYQSDSGWEEVELYDPSESFSHEASRGGLYRFIAHYTSGSKNPTQAVNVKWSDVGYKPLAQLSDGRLTIKGLPAGSYQVASYSLQGQTLLSTKVDLAEMQSESLALTNREKIVILKISGPSGESYLAKVVQNNFDNWNPVIEK